MKNFCIAGFVVFVSVFFNSCTDNNLDELNESHEKIQAIVKDGTSGPGGGGQGQDDEYDNDEL